MKIQILSPTGYRDRFGQAHKLGDVVDLPDRIVEKLVRYRIGKIVSRPMAVQQTPRPRGRPRKTETKE